MSTDQVTGVADDDQRIKDLFGMVNELENRVQELEEENERLREERGSESVTVEYKSEGDKQQLEDLYIGNLPVGKFISNVIDREEVLRDAVFGAATTQEEVAERVQLDNPLEVELREEFTKEIRSEQQTRTSQDSMIERKVSMIAEETGVDLTDTDVAGEDKIKRLLQYGPEDVADRVYEVHHRARETLAHAGDWGTTSDDKFGKRIQLKAPEVKERLELTRGETLQSKQVRDVFEKIAQLAADSPRKVKADTGGDGVNTLTIHLTEDEVERRD